MNTIISSLLCAVACAIFITVKFAYELCANRKRVERGETPKKYHDATDYPAPADVIDWTRR